MENKKRPADCDYYKEPQHLAGTERPKMPARQRAKQFMPFAAVTGLDSAIRKVEEEVDAPEGARVSD